MRFLTLIFVLITHISFAQQKRSWQFNNLGLSGVILNEGWKYKVGDDISWANLNYDDTSWENIDPTKDVTDLPQIQHGKIGWLRLHINIDSSLMTKQFGINIIQFIASEVFINGQLVQKYGQLDTTDVHANYVHENIILPRNTPKIVISVRFAYQKSLLYNRFGAMPNACFGARLVLIKNPLESDENWGIGNALNFITVGLFLMMFIFHFALYLMFPAQKNNLYFSGLALFYIIFILSWSIYYFTSPIEKVELLMYFGIFRMMTFIITFVLLLIALYNIFDFKKNIIFWIVIGLNTLLLFNYLFFSNFHVPFTELTTRNVNLLACLYISIKAVLLKKVNAKFILIGTIIAIIFTGIRSLGFWGVVKFPMGIQGYFLFLGIISIPVSISCYLGGEFANISKKLRLKLKEVQDLSEEKQQILTTHNETLEKQVEQRTAELKASQNQLIQKEKLASLGELTAGIAHEIQNPLNFVNNFSELSVDLVKDLKDEMDKPDQDKPYINELFDDLSQNQEKINHHGKRASSIVKGMLEHSRTSTGERALTDINALADEYLRLSYHGMRAKDKSFNADYKTDFDENLSKIEVIPQDIGRVLLNLINNAFYAVQERNLRGFQNLEGLNTYTPSVIVSTQRADNQIILSVKDNGNGMPENIKAKIFQPFFTTKPTGQGTGLGLSLAYDIVTKGHGGTLEVETTEGVGSEFIIHLPIKTKEIK